MEAINQKLIAALFVALTSAPISTLASPVLGPELSTFAVLGASTVTNTGPTILTGNLGVSGGSAITGFFGTQENDGPGLFTGTAHQADATAGLAQTQLGFAMSSLGLMSPTASLAADLAGQTLVSGVYSVPAGVTNLDGTLILDGQNNANAYWVFQMASTLITSSGSSISLVNAGPEVGVFWNVGSSATLGSTTLFQGNILASASISFGSGASIGCGGAFAHTGAVTMITNAVSTGCGGGLDVQTLGEAATPLPFAPAVPEPGTYALMLAGLGLLGFARIRKSRRDANESFPAAR